MVKIFKRLVGAGLIGILCVSCLAACGKAREEQADAVSVEETEKETEDEYTDSGYQVEISLEETELYLETEETTEGYVITIGEDSVEPETPVEVTEMSPGIYMSVVGFEDSILTIEAANISGDTYVFKDNYALYKYDGDAWNELSMPDDYVLFTEVQNEMTDMESRQIGCNMKIFEPLEEGQYQLVIDDMSVDFYLNADGTLSD